MILQHLSEHYDRLSFTDAKLPRRGFSSQSISFCCVIESDGRLNSFQSLISKDGNREQPQLMLVPGQTKSSGSGFNPCFLWDQSRYLLGYKKDDDDPERTRTCFEEFRKLHLAKEAAVNHPQFSAVCAFLRSWSPEMAKGYAQQLDAITKNNGVFRLANRTEYVHEAIGEFLTREQERGTEESRNTGMCLVTGQEVPIARLHEPKIKGVKGTKMAEVPLVSFDDPAFRSLGKMQGDNAPVGSQTVFKYCNALNYLLKPGGRKFYLADATVVFWADRPAPLEEDAISDLFGSETLNYEETPLESKERLRQVRQFLTQLRDGTEITAAIDGSDNTRFFILGLSPSSARIFVRFWIDMSVEELREKLRIHVRDLNLYQSREYSTPSLWLIVAATGRAEFQNRKFKRFDTDAVSPLLAGALARAVRTGSAYPQSLLTTMLGRIRADGEIHPVRCAAIKACLVRNSRMRGNPLEVPVALDIAKPEPAYNIGRLFALLEKAQTDSAETDLNSTIKDRYFSSASTTPAIVFPRLLRLNQHHLAKLSAGHKIFYEKLIGGVVGKLTSWPAHFNIDEQGLFVIGYYHQRQDLFTSKKSENQGESE